MTGADSLKALAQESLWAEPDRECDHKGFRKLPGAVPAELVELVSEARYCEGCRELYDIRLRGGP